MSITLNAAPNLTGVSYYVEQPAGTFTAGPGPINEVIIGGVHTGAYQAPEPAAYVGIQWLDGRGGAKYAPVWTPPEQAPNTEANTVLQSLKSGAQQFITTKFRPGTGTPYNVSYQGIFWAVPDSMGGTVSVPQPIAAALIAQGFAS